MSALHPVPAVLLAFALVAGATILAVLLVRFARVRARARRRVVEKPNSHYTPPGVRDVEARHRWRDIALDRVHEINRGEVVRLIGKAEAAGAEALRPQERAFLDQIALNAGRIPAPEPRQTTRPPNGLQELPAS